MRGVIGDRTCQQAWRYRISLTPILPATRSCHLTMPQMVLQTAERADSRGDPWPILDRLGWQLIVPLFARGDLEST